MNVEEYEIKTDGLLEQVRCRLGRMGDGMLYLMMGFAFLMGEIVLLLALGVL